MNFDLFLENIDFACEVSGQTFVCIGILHFRKTCIT